MNPKRLINIAKKDLIEVSRNKAASLPMLILPLVFVVLLPLGMIYGIQASADTANAMTSDPDLQLFLTHLPQATQAYLNGLTPEQNALALILGMMMAPMFLVLPLMFSTIIAAESFAGEFERKTMESLLYTPTTDLELFAGKVLAGVIPSVLITWVSFLVYIVVLNGFSYPIFHAIWFPLSSWWPLIFWISPAISLMSVAITVLISAKVKNFMGTYQMSGSLVLVVIALFVGQMTGVVVLDVLSGMLIGVGCWIIAGVVLGLALKLFNRQKLLLDVV